MSRSSGKLLLKESKGATQELDALLFACANSQKLYGREPQAFKAAIRVLHNVLGPHPAEKAIKSLQTWLERSTEFPTPADLISLIRRNGKPPLKESDIIAIRKKDGEERTREDWATLREWDAQQQEGWKEFDDPVKDDATLRENLRLRQEVRDLRSEVSRLGEMLKSAQPAPLPPTMQEKIAKTVEAMKASGAPQQDIDEFIAGQAA